MASMKNIEPRYKINALTSFDMQKAKIKGPVSLALQTTKDYTWLLRQNIGSVHNVYAMK